MEFSPAPAPYVPLLQQTRQQVECGARGSSSSPTASPMSITTMAVERSPTCGKLDFDMVEPAQSFDTSSSSSVISSLPSSSPHTRFSTSSTYTSTSFNSSRSSARCRPLSLGTETTTTNPFRDELLLSRSFSEGVVPAGNGESSLVVSPCALGKGGAYPTRVRRPLEPLLPNSPLSPKANSGVESGVLH